MRGAPTGSDRGDECAEERGPLRGFVFVRFGAGRPMDRIVISARTEHEALTTFARGRHRIREAARTYYDLVEVTPYDRSDPDLAFKQKLAPADDDREHGSLELGEDGGAARDAAANVGPLFDDPPTPDPATPPPIPQEPTRKLDDPRDELFQGGGRSFPNPKVP